MLDPAALNTHRRLADVAHGVALDPAPLNGTRPVPQRQVPSALAVQRDGLPTLQRTKTLDFQRTDTKAQLSAH